MEIARKRSGRPALFILLALVVFAVALRIVLPDLIKGIANNRLKKESPYFTFHIDDVDLEILKGRYEVKGISGIITSNKENFLNVNSVVADVPWKNVFKGAAAADVAVNNLHLAASQVLVDTAKLEAERMKEKAAKEEKKPADEEREPKFFLNSLALRDSHVLIHDLLSFRGEEEVREISDINLLARNLTPTENNPRTDFSLNANIFGPAPLRVLGSAQLKEKAFDVNADLKNFNLPSLNPFIREKVQAFIHKGKLDTYAEVVGSGETIEGYVKPFVSGLRMDTPPGGFQFKGAAAAAGGNLVKVLLTDSEAKTLATEAPFKLEKDKKDFDIIAILQAAVVHKARQNIQPGIKDTLGKKGLLPQTEAIEAEEDVR